MKFILIISLLSIAPGHGIDYKNLDYKFEKFDTEKACNDAKDAVMKMAVNYYTEGKPAKMEGRVVARCVPRG